MRPISKQYLNLTDAGGTLIQSKNVAEDTEDSPYGLNRLKGSNKYDNGTLLPEIDRNGAEVVDDIFSVSLDVKNLKSAF